jgi:uncharacterized damage-inducible protein DinB
LAAPGIRAASTIDPNPAQRIKEEFIEKYRADATRELEILRAQSDEWWHENTQFFDVTRTRAWVMTRRIAHSSHHLGQLVVYLQAGRRVRAVRHGPSA